MRHGDQVGQLDRPLAHGHEVWPPVPHQALRRAVQPGHRLLDDHRAGIGGRGGHGDRAGELLAVADDRDALAARGVRRLDDQREPHPLTGLEQPLVGVALHVVVAGQAEAPDHLVEVALVGGGGQRRGGRPERRPVVLGEDPQGRLVGVAGRRDHPGHLHRAQALDHRLRLPGADRQELVGQRDRRRVVALVHADRAASQPPGLQVGRDLVGAGAEDEQVAHEANSRWTAGAFAGSCSYRSSSGWTGMFASLT
jgi:hypothetical protein